MHCWFKKRSRKSRATITRNGYVIILIFALNPPEADKGCIPRPLGGVVHYGFNQSNMENLSYFIKKLKEKNQTEQQQKQAFHAISIYFDTEFTDKDKKVPLKNKKRILSSKK